MTYGIDRIVQDKADAYRGNPAALQKRSAMSKELIDMLALQKITSEKDAAARDMQLQMEQQPGTIAQQLEQKAVGQTKNEMLKGVAGVMKTNQAKQQANMQRMASAGLPKTAAAGPPQGLAAQPKPNMQRMAQGGIVGYAPGGPVEAQEKFDEIAKIRKQIADGTISKAEGYKKIEALSPGLSSAYRTKPLESGPAKYVQSPLDRRGLDATGLQAAITERNENQQSMDSTLAGMQGNALGTGASQGRGQGTAKAPPQAVFGMEDEYDDKPPVVQPPAAQPPAAKTNALNAGLGQVTAPDKRTKFLDPQAYNVSMSDASSTEGALAGIKGLMDQDPKEARAEAMKYGLDTLGMSDDRIAAETARQKAVADLDARQLDPKKLQRERLSAFLRGTSRAGSFAGGSQGLADVRAQQELAERNRLLGRQGAERSFEKEQQEIRVKAFDSAKDAYKIANENVAKGVTAITQFNSTQVSMLSNNAKNVLQADEANMKAEDRDIKRIMEAAMHNASQGVKVAVANLEADTADKRMNLQAELDMLKIEQLDRGKAEDTLSKVAKYMGDIRAEYEKIYQERITSLGLAGEPDPAKVEALKEEMNAAIIISLKPLADRAKDVEARIAGTYGDTSGKYQQGSMTVSP